MVQMTRREQIGALVLVGLLVAGLVLRVALAPKPGNFVVEPPTEVSTEAETEKEVNYIVVHVAGAVARPGVYSLPEGARVHEAVTAAGGALAEADPHALNLAEPLYDGRRITVPLVMGKQDQPGGPVESGKVNINEADVQQLETLPGIGPTKAAAIYNYRDKNGPFRSLDDLAQVPGIGPKTVESLKEYISLY
jgi:competence protein ComEA